LVVPKLKACKKNEMCTSRARLAALVRLSRCCDRSVELQALGWRRQIVRAAIRAKAAVAAGRELVVLVQLASFS